MAISTPEQFWDVLGRSQLLEATVVSRLQSEYAGRVLPPEHVAWQLVERKFLSLWQAQRLLAGQSNFTLGKYKLLDMLGQGGMGAVFKAEHVVMGRIVALKILARARLSNPSAVARFRREVKAAAALDHPNIITAHDAGQIGERHYLVMEYVEGIDLNSWLLRWGAVPFPLASELMRQAALGLEHAYQQGLVHRDIKPANLLVTWSEGMPLPVVKILDLGLARFSRQEEEEQALDAADAANAPRIRDTTDADLTQVGQILGTPDYLSPEQILGGSEIDIRSDLFSLGCTFFKLLTGQLPFAGKTVMDKLQARISKHAPPPIALRHLCPSAPPGLETIVAKMVALDPNRRYQNPREVGNALRPYCLTAQNAVEVLGTDRLPSLPAPADQSSLSGDAVEPALREFLDQLTRDSAAGNVEEESLVMEFRSANPSSVPLMPPPSSKAPAAVASSAAAVAPSAGSARSTANVITPSNVAPSNYATSNVAPSNFSSLSGIKSGVVGSPASSPAAGPPSAQPLVAQPVVAQPVVAQPVVAQPVVAQAVPPGTSFAPPVIATVVSTPAAPRPSATPASHVFAPPRPGSSASLQRPEKISAELRSPERSRGDLRRRRRWRRALFRLTMLVILIVIVLAAAAFFRARSVPELGPKNLQGLVFHWLSGDPQQPRARSASLQAQGEARLGRHFDLELIRGSFRATPAVEKKLLTDLQATSQMTLMAWIMPGRDDFSGPARILSFSSDALHRNVTLGQENDRLLLRLRTDQTGPNGTPDLDLGPVPVGKRAHLLVTYRSGECVAYLNGREAFRTASRTGNFRNWMPCGLVFGNEIQADRPWLGRLDGIAIYNRFFTPVEARAAFDDARSFRPSSAPVPQTLVHAKLVRTNAFSSGPAPQALVVYEYEITRVMNGPARSGRCLVYHWGVLNGQVVPDVARRLPGQYYPLLLEPFEQQPQLQTLPAIQGDLPVQDSQWPKYLAVEPFSANP